MQSVEMSDEQYMELERIDAICFAGEDCSDKERESRTFYRKSALDDAIRSAKIDVAQDLYRLIGSSRNKAEAMRRIGDVLSELDS